jgi:predicted phosphodiesterase
VRIFALSDVHVDFELNAQWVTSISQVEYVDDLLILAGDVSDSVVQLEHCLGQLARCFKKLLFIPGNHDLWVIRGDKHHDSLHKFKTVCEVAERNGASMATYHHGNVSIVPLLGWYDYTFGSLEPGLQSSWMDFFACKWSDAWDMEDVALHFLRMNGYHRRDDKEFIISFSHFVPRVDLLPRQLPDRYRKLFPVLGSSRLGQQVNRLRSDIHVYGHSHINRRLRLDGTLYINNAFGYPHEVGIAAKELICIHECL